MFQSDYIQSKKVARVLKKQKDLESVLSSNNYTNFKTFMIGDNTIPKECEIFKFCKDTNMRENRVITMTDIMGKRGYTRHHGYNEYIVNQKVKNLIMPCKMLEECDEFLNLRNSMDKTQRIKYVMLLSQ
jgi:hypothetical protein